MLDTLLETMKKNQIIRNQFLGGMYDYKLPKKVFFNHQKKTTVILWKDNTKTIVKTHNEKYDKRTGFLIAYFQKNCGLSKNKANKYIDNLCEDKVEILEF